MKTTKLIIGIISMVLFCVIAFQSCAAGIYNAIDDNDEISGTAGFFLAVCLLIAGILCVVMRKGISGGFVASGFYLVGSLVGLLCFGTFADLVGYQSDFGRLLFNQQHRYAVPEKQKHNRQCGMTNSCRHQFTGGLKNEANFYSAIGCHVVFRYPALFCGM